MGNILFFLCFFSYPLIYSINWKNAKSLEKLAGKMVETRGYLEASRSQSRSVGPLGSCWDNCLAPCAPPFYGWVPPLKPSTRVVNIHEYPMILRVSKLLSDWFEHLDYIGKLKTMGIFSKPPIHPWPLEFPEVVDDPTKRIETIGKRSLKISKKEPLGSSKFQ